MDEERERVYKPKHQKRHIRMWWGLLIVMVVMFSWLTISLIQLSGFTWETVFPLTLMLAAFVFNAVYFGDLLMDDYLKTSKTGIVYNDLWGTITYEWSNATSIKKFFLSGQRLVFTGRPAYTRNRKWSWGWPPDRWPIIGKLRFASGIHLDDWENKESLLQEIRQYAPQVFLNESKL